MLSIVQNIVAGFVVIIILAILGWFKRKALADFLEQRYFYNVSTRYLRELKRYIASRGHPAAGVLMAVIAKKSAVHLFKPEGEEVTLDEYGEMLCESLSQRLSKCLFIAKTKPSDWFSPGHIGRRIKDYFDKQKSLAKTVDVKRYIILPKDTIDNDPDKENLRHEHESNNIKLHFIHEENLPTDFKICDLAIFFDKKNRAWAIESLNFDKNTIQNYIRTGSLIHIKVRVIDDQALLANYYSDIIKLLEMLTPHTE